MSAEMLTKEELFSLFESADRFMLNERYPVDLGHRSERRDSKMQEIIQLGKEILPVILEYTATTNPARKSQLEYLWCRILYNIMVVEKWDRSGIPQLEGTDYPIYQNLPLFEFQIRKSMENPA